MAVLRRISKRKLAVLGLTLAFSLLANAGLTAFAHRGHSHRQPRPAVTKIRFKLDDHEITLGETVNGTATVFSRSGRRWVPLAGATLSVQVDGAEVGTVTTDENGRATISYTPTTEGEHVIKVVYAGDATHKKAKRAQGFEVEPAAPPVEEAPVEEAPAA